MKPEEIELQQWERIEWLYHTALGREANERAAFLAAVCAGDEELRRQVELLLSCDARAEDFIEAPALEFAAHLQTEEQESSLIGRRLGPYQILALIGAGGMRSEEHTSELQSRGHLV